MMMRRRRGKEAGPRRGLALGGTSKPLPEHHQHNGGGRRAAERIHPGELSRRHPCRPAGEVTVENA